MRVNEIFYSLQGEGRWTGTASVFVRLSGCNLKCWFCDTKHEEGTEMTEEEIVNRIIELSSNRIIEQSNYRAIETSKHQNIETSNNRLIASNLPHVVITGGEPGLQLTKSLIYKLHDAGYFVQIETNGTIQLPEGIDWVTCSPKGANIENLMVFAPSPVDELKVVYTHPGMDLTPYLNMPAREYRLQPCDTGDTEKNQQILQRVIQTIKENPQWRLSLQTHKIISIP